MGFMGSKSFKITGSYQLIDYDENLNLFLDSLGINGNEFGSAFRKTKVKIFVREPSKHNKKWSLIHKEEGNYFYNYLSVKTMCNSIASS